MIEKRYQKKSKHLVTYESVNQKEVVSNRESEEGRRAEAMMRKKGVLKRKDSDKCLANENGYVTFKPFKALSDRKVIESSNFLRNND